MPRAKKEQSQEDIPVSQPKVFGYVVGRAPADQEHPDKNDKN